MKFAVATWPDKPRTKDSTTASIGLAIVLAVMAASQLFRLDNFMPLLDSFELPGISGRTAAIILTLTSVFAVPFLFQMKLSLGFRYLSMLCGWVAVSGWLFITLWLNFAGVAVTNVGLLGSEVTLIPGWWAVFVALALVILAAWSAWGLWPGKRRQAKTVSLKNNLVAKAAKQESKKTSP